MCEHFHIKICLIHLVPASPSVSMVPSILQQMQQENLKINENINKTWVNGKIGL